MITLEKELSRRGYSYKSIFGCKAEDVYFESIEDLCFALGYIVKHVERVDAEIPDNFSTTSKMGRHYSITNGVTSGGYVMKEAPQFRIYFKTISQMPDELRERLQNDDKMRITGSRFVEACMKIGFVPGADQNKKEIQSKILEIFHEENEKEAFRAGYES